MKITGTPEALAVELHELPLARRSPMLPLT
jgi:hypothetical protein